MPIPARWCISLRLPSTTSCTARVNSLVICWSLRRYTWVQWNIFCAIWLEPRIWPSSIRREVSSSAFSDSNWGNNPDNRKSTSCYIMILSRAPVSFKSGVQSLTAMSTMEAELVASALAMKQAVFCSNMMTELGFGKEFGHVPPHIDNTATLHVIGNRAFSSRTKHIALRFSTSVNWWRKTRLLRTTFQRRID